MNTKTKGIVGVIGGGISGLSFAHYCSTHGYRATIFDAGRRRACIKSYSGPAEEPLDLGAHTLYNSYGEIIELLRHYRAEDLIIPRERLQFEKFAGKHESLTAGLDWAELLLHLPRLLLQKKSGLPVREYYRNILGKKNYDTLFRFAFQAVLCQPPDEYPSELLFKKRQRSKSYPRSFTLRGGLESLVNILAQNPGIQMEENEEIVRLGQREGGFRMTGQKGEQHETHCVCFSCPPHTAAALLKDMEPRLAGMLEEIPSVKVNSLLINTGVASNTRTKARNIIGVGQAFYSALSYCVNGEAYWLFHFPDHDESRADQLKVAGKVLGLELKPSNLREERQTELPALKASHLPLLREIDQYIEHKPLFIASNYMQGLSIEDCCERSRKEALRFRKLAVSRLFRTSSIDSNSK